MASVIQLQCSCNVCLQGIRNQLVNELTIEAELSMGQEGNAVTCCNALRKDARDGLQD